MNFFRKNADFLKHQDSKFGDVENILQGLEAYPVQTTRRGELWLEIQGQAVHGRVAPLKEALKIYRKMESERQIHCGFGLGYFLKAQLEYYPDSRSKLYIFEPDPRLLRTALEHFDWQEVLRNRAIRFFIGEKPFLDALELELPDSDVYPLFVMPFHRVQYDSTIARVTQKLRRLVQQRAFFKHSDRRLGPVFAKATLTSLPYWLNAHRFDEVMMKLKNMPAVVISPGPSLEKNLHQLIAYRDGVVIFAVSRVVRILERFGIEPDFLIHIEAQDFIELIDGATNLGSTYFVLHDQVEPKYFQFPCRGIITYHNATNKMANLIYEALPEAKRMSLPTGGSVAHNAFSAAVFMGCNPITLIGQDLALHVSRMYSSGTKGTTETFPTLPIKGFFGTQVETLGNYNQFRIWFEEAVDAYRDHFPEVRFFNSTEGGANIKGFSPISLRYFLRKYHLGKLKWRLKLGNILNTPYPNKVAINGFKSQLKKWSSLLSDCLGDGLPSNSTMIQKSQLEIKLLSAFLGFDLSCGKQPQSVKESMTQSEDNFSREKAYLKDLLSNLHDAL